MNLNPKLIENTELSIQQAESFRAFGFMAHLTFPLSISNAEIGFEQDIKYNVDQVIDVWISLDSTPKRKLLNSLGWVYQDHENYPLIAYIPRFIPQDWSSPRRVNSKVVEIQPVKYTKVDLEYDYQDHGKKFLIGRLSAINFNPINYIVQLIPENETMPDNPIHGNDPNLKKLEIEDGKNNFRWLNHSRVRQERSRY
jgi:hypothetical protein